MHCMKDKGGHKLKETISTCTVKIVNTLELHMNCKFQMVDKITWHSAVIYMIRWQCLQKCNDNKCYNLSPKLRDLYTFGKSFAYQTKLCSLNIDFSIRLVYTSQKKRSIFGKIQQWKIITIDKNKYSCFIQTRDLLVNEYIFWRCKQFQYGLTSTCFDVLP